MRARRIVKVRDLMQSQQRVTVLAECGHWSSIPATTVQQMPREQLADLRDGGEIACPHCPDAPDEKTATQMWREAGEP